MHATEEACKRARQALKAQGLSIRSWAKLNEVHESTAYAVLNGQKLCLRGNALRAAQLLGIVTVHGQDKAEHRDEKTESAC